MACWICGEFTGPCYYQTEARKLKLSIHINLQSPWVLNCTVALVGEHNSMSGDFSSSSLHNWPEHLMVLFPIHSRTALAPSSPCGNSGGSIYKAIEHGAHAITLYLHTYLYTPRRKGNILHVPSVCICFSSFAIPIPTHSLSGSFLKVNFHTRPAHGLGMLPPPRVPARVLSQTGLILILIVSR